jgi:hypothetical protein
MKLLLAFALVAGCATSGTVAATRTPHQPYAVERIVIGGPRAGELSASREWQRAPGGRAIGISEEAELRDTFARDLGRLVPLDVTAPVRIRATLTLQDVGYYEGLAAETTDVTLTAELVDANGNVSRIFTLREPASAPLQRSASRRARLDAAFDRLAHRLAALL